MSGLFDMQQFYRFLEKARDKELAQKQELLARFIDNARDPDVLKDARFLLRKVEEEILARLNTQQSED
ncbi:MAG: hypothetical protein ABW104_18055 [Candidatus Thiodiazotropha sp. 6PLUC2]|nr:hypothetical protein [Candidatus Thiodiazotropha lotti]MCW4218801.1 hypothetical protein [Candidatus Thiodiazotropha lotti]